MIRRRTDPPAFFVPHEEPTKKALELTDFRDAHSDPLGSYTGRPIDPHETPVQDADDL